MDRGFISFHFFNVLESAGGGECDVDWVGGAVFPVPAVVAGESGGEGALLGGVGAFFVDVVVDVFGVAVEVVEGGGGVG